MPSATLNRRHSRVVTAPQIPNPSSTTHNAIATAPNGVPVPGHECCTLSTARAPFSYRGTVPNAGMTIE